METFPAYFRPTFSWEHHENSCRQSLQVAVIETLLPWKLKSISSREGHLHCWQQTYKSGVQCMKTCDSIYMVNIYTDTYSFKVDNNIFHTKVNSSVSFDL
jgi:hypothetical protein